MTRGEKILAAHRRRSTGLHAGLAILALTATHRPAAAQATGTGDQDIVVTARGKEEKLVDVPIAIATFSDQDIVRSNVRTVVDLAARIPNFSITEAQQPGVSFINVRGIGQARNGDSPLAVIVDGVQINSAFQITQQLLDVQQVEVLRGPQGALYGRNAIGGAIVIRTRRPGDTLEGRILGAYGTGRDWRLSGYVAGPLAGEKLGFKLSGYFRDFRGDIDSLFAPGKANGDEQRNVTAGLYFTPDDALTIDLTYSRQDQDASGAHYSPRVPGSRQSNIVGDWNGTFINRSKRRSDDVSLRAALDLGTVTLSSITAYSKVRASLAQDLDLSPLNLFNAFQATRSRGISQELRIASTDAGPFQWTFGAYYLNTRYRLATTIIFPPDPTGTGFSPPGSALQVVPEVRQNNDSYALFGQLSYRFDSGIELTAGTRYDIDERKAQGRPGLTFKSFQPRISIGYFPAPDQQFYASLARGYRSGGYNAVPGPEGTYGAEKAWTYEIGYKGALSGGRIRPAITLFYNDISDRQLYAFDFGNASQIIRNPIGKARAYGIEAELAATPVESLELSASLGLLNTKIRRYDPSGGFAGGADFTGNKLPYSAPVTYAASGQYRFEAGDDLAVIPRFELTGYGPWYWEISNADRRRNVTLVNARLTIEHGSAYVRGYVENLLKKKYNVEFLQAEFNGAPFDIAGRAPGRRWGIELGWSF